MPLELIDFQEQNMVGAFKKFNQFEKTGLIC